MRKDLVIIPDDEPGQLAKMGEVAGAAGINIEALSAFTGQGKGIVHLLVDDAEKALEAFTAAGFQVKAARSVVVIDIVDEPGQMGIACRKLADAEINVEQAYIAASSQLVIVTEDVDGAKTALGMA